MNSLNQQLAEGCPDPFAELHDCMEVIASFASAGVALGIARGGEGW